jgi:cobalt-zinc-cadmium efflux system protein
VSEHSHAHEANAGHTHAAVSAQTNQRRLAFVLILIVAFVAGEVVAGILANSLALLSDAAHMLTDAGAIGLSLVALRLAQRPAAGSLTFGFKRAEILSAQVNGVTLLVLSAWITYGAITRLISPSNVGGWTMLFVALSGVGVNVVATWQLAKANRENMAVEGSFQHIVTDLYAFIGTLIAAAIILATGFDRADPIVSLVVVCLMLRSAYGLLRDSGRVLLEAAPEGLDVDEIAAAIASDPRVVDVHDLHWWEIGSGFPSLSAHVLVRPGDDCHAARRDIEGLISERFGIEHTTLQVDHQPPSRLRLPRGRLLPRGRYAI